MADVISGDKFVTNKYTLKMTAYRILMIFAASCLLSIMPAIAQNTATINHTVKAGETLYSIARLYKVDVKEIFDVNSISDKEYKVKIGDVLKVPSRNAENTSSTASVTNELVPITTHHVMQGETLYKIAAMYNTTPEVIKQLNGLKSDGVNIGQILKVPSSGTVTERTAPTPEPTVTTPDVKPITEEDKKDITGMKTAYAHDYNENEATYIDKGMAMWIDDSNEESGSRFYALHKTAPAGTILKVRNLMNDKVAFVKVVGKLPEIEENNNVIVKVSGATAKYLEVIDPKFLVEISFVNKKN
jgi:LysM repeat protein